MPLCSDVGDQGTTVKQVHWHLAEQTPVGQHAQLVIDLQCNSVILNPRPTGHMRPAGMFYAARRAFKNICWCFLVSY